MDKRANIRKYYDDKANQFETGKSFADLAARISSSEETTANAFKALLDLIDGKTTKTEVINQLTSISTPDVTKVVQAIVSADKDKLTANDLKGLETAVNKAVRELSLIPKSHAKYEQKDSIKVTNLGEVKLDNTDVIKAIEKLDIKPVVDVKAPIVNVEKTDIKPLVDLTRDVLKATQANKPIEYPEFPDIPATDLTKVEKKLDESNKHLKTISEKKFGGGSSGGGSGTPYVDPAGGFKYVELIDGKVPVNIDTVTSSEEAILLRRLVKIMESNAVTDREMRQKVVIENIAGTTLGRSMTGMDSGAVASPNQVTAQAPQTATGTTYFQPVWVGPVDQRYQIMDAARNAYANSIRNNISFS